MISNYLKTAFRAIVRQPLFFIINILGLAVGITCVILISLWVLDELSFDKFHAKSDKIYRVIMDMDQYGNLAQTPPPLIYKIKEDFPEVINATRIKNCPKLILKNKAKIFCENEGIFADPSFFEMFSFPIIRGNQNDLLSDPFHIILTEDIAKKYFGKKDPLNKTLIVNGYPVIVTGILKTIPQNSHLQFSFVLPIDFAVHLGNNLNTWGNVNLYTYIEVEEGTNFTKLNQKVIHLKTPRKESFFLQPLKNIHQEADYNADIAVISDKKYVMIFSSIALFILLLASVNYITLYISSSFNRTKEIGIRKIIGSNRRNIIVQFLSESFIHIIFALLIAVLLIKILLPYFNTITHKQLSFLFPDYRVFAGLFVIGLVLIIFVGLYPAMLFSSFKPSKILKNGKSKLGALSSLKRGMIFIQFSVTTVLIIGISIIYKQLDFIQHKDLGFQNENIIYTAFNGISKHYNGFKDELLNIPSVVNISAKNSLPIESADNTDAISWPNQSPNQLLLMEATAVDYNYIETMGLTIVEGRSFSINHGTDDRGVILNQTAVKQMDLTNPVGKTIRLWGHYLTIIGVVNDALFYSLKEKIGPQILYMIQDIKDREMSDYGVLLIKITGDNIKETISSIKTVWKSYYPDIPFKFNFLDNAIGNKYWEEQRLFTIMKLFVILSIGISCLGLFGMAIFSTRQRIKEIGIRKVNGAKLWEIIAILNKEPVKWVATAFIFASPIAWYIMHKWLDNFTYKTNFSWWIFALAGFSAFLITIITVSLQSWRAATRNPVEALRYE